MQDFLAQFLGNVVRARVLRTLVSHEAEDLSLPHIAKRAGTSTTVAGREIQALAKWGILRRGKVSAGSVKGRGREQGGPSWILNPDFRHYRALRTFIQETSPVEYKNVEKALKGSGRLSAVILSGVFVGDMSRPVDILVAGDALNERRLQDAMRGLEPLFGREIRYAAFSTPEFRYRLTVQDRLLRETLDYPHRVLLSRVNLT